MKRNTLFSVERLVFSAKCLLACLFTLPMMTVEAQTVGDAFYIYRNDGGFNAFFRDEVDSITYSCYDLDSVYYNDYVMQVVYTPDSIYRIPLATIDSVGFVQPETKYVSDVVLIEPLLPYIDFVDGLTITFSSGIPTSLMPRVGDVLLLDNFDFDKLPDGFAGKVIESNGLQVICDSVSFEDIFEQIVCYGSYTVINDETSRRMRLVPRRIGGGVSSSIGINGSIGSTGTGGFANINGNLGLDLRVTFNFGVGKSTYFDLSLAPQLGLTIQSGVKGNFSNNVLSNKVNLFAIPIPDTPFLLKLKAGPVLKFSVDASVTAITQTTLGYRFGVKYENGSFTGYGQNGTKWFSMPDVEGHISGSIFAGVQTEFGIFSYGDILSLSMTKEAGAEFVANLTEDLLNTDKYMELQKGKFDLNLRASVGVSARAKFYKWVNASANWELLSGRLNINSWKLVPTFQRPTVSVNSSSTATATVIPSEKLLFPVSIGLGLWDKDEALHDAQYCPKTYRVFENWGDTQYQTTFSGLTPNQDYTIKPLVKLFGMEIMASPSETFQTKEFPVTIDNFKQTKSQYKKGGFTHEGVNYDYRYDVAVTVSIEDLEGVADWGYVYRDPNSRDKEISLRSHGTSYTDNSYAYFRNTSPATVTLFGYVKYVGNDETVYGEPTDYTVSHAETSCPDENHPHWIDLGLPSGTLWRCCNEGASTPEAYGGYYQFGQVSSAPTLDQIRELDNYCWNEWTTQNGANGVKFTGPKGTIFLPAAGCRLSGILYTVGGRGNYWSATLTPYYNNGYDAYCLAFGWGDYWDLGYDYYWIDSWNMRRINEYSVRPVRSN